MNNSEMALIVKRLEGRERGMEAEESVEIDNLIARNGDAGAHGVVVLLAVGHHDVEAIGRSALKDDDEAAAWAGRRNGCCFGHHRANKKAWDGRGAGYC